LPCPAAENVQKQVTRVRPEEFLAFAIFFFFLFFLFFFFFYSSVSPAFDSHNFNGKTPFREVGKGKVQPTRQRTEQPKRPISDLKPVTQEAYGGGLYGTEKDAPQRPKDRPPASQSQSADALAGDVSPAKNPLSRPPPPSSGDRDVDITGQSYIQ
jgi:hypothetical protein